MQAFRLNGSRSFRNAGMGGGDGLRSALKRRVTGESISLMQCSGRGTVWFAKDAMEVLVVELAGDTLKVESEQLLALSDQLRTDVAALLSAGGPPIALRVTPRFPLVVDPDAFIASQGRLDQTFVTDVSWRNLIGESSGEAFSLRFDGDGVVYIQPEER